MKVAHLLVSVSRVSGGLFHSVAGMALSEAAIPGVVVDVHGVRDQFTEADLLKWAPILPQVHAPAGPGFLGYAPGLREAVDAGNYDILHNHGLWQDVSRLGSGWRKATRRPHVVSPRGMLDPWALANSGWKKKLVGALFENRHLREASCLHALCESEAASMRAYGLRNPIAVVPNGVALPAQRGDGWRVQQCFGNSVGRSFGGKPKTLLFLGRLHPKKGLPAALRAWAQVTRGKETGWRFVIAGWDQGGHEAELKRMCEELGVRFSENRGQRSEVNRSAAEMGRHGDQRSEGTVVFAGPAFGEVKETLLRSADAFILPSLSEGLPMSVLEAWAHGLPVLMTTECNLPEGFAAGAAIRIGPGGPSDEGESAKVGAGAQRRQREAQPWATWKGGKVSVAEGMRRLMEMTDEERAAMGARGRALVEERFTWPKVGSQMVDVYAWLLGGAPQPACVQV